MQCREVVAVPIEEAAKFKAITLVRGIACSFKVTLLQKLAVSSTSLSLSRRHFTNWREERSNEHFPGTELYTASTHEKDVDKVRDWFHSAIVSSDIVYEHTSLLATF